MVETIAGPRRRWRAVGGKSLMLTALIGAMPTDIAVLWFCSGKKSV